MKTPVLAAPLSEAEKASIFDSISETSAQETVLTQYVERFIQKNALVGYETGDISKRKLAASLVFALVLAAESAWYILYHPPLEFPPVIVVAADNALTMDTFVNCLCLGLRDYYYGSESEKTADITDFDILGYRDQQCMMQDRNVYVTTDVSVRFVRTDGEKVWSKETQKRIRLKKSAHGGQGAKAGLNITTCPYCGASIDLVEKKCSYCGTAFAYERALNIESVSG